MKLDGGISSNLVNAASSAQALETAGYSGGWTAETAHDPFFPLLLAAEHTSKLEIGTSIAVAFARNPMTLANIGWDLQSYSQGRFILGLGSQIKPHITKRFSMDWSHPAPRMREMIQAIRAIWGTWLTGEPLPVLDSDIGGEDDCISPGDRCRAHRSAARRALGLHRQLHTGPPRRQLQGIGGHIGVRNPGGTRRDRDDRLALGRNCCDGNRGGVGADDGVNECDDARGGGRGPQ